MPEFVPQHTPAGLDDFTRMYVSAIEWLLHTSDEDSDETIGRDEIEGFAPSAIAKAVADCAEFQNYNADDLTAYCEQTGRDMECAGLDYYLTRCRHGAGFWDRGDGAVIDRLTAAARADGSVDHYIGDDRLVYEAGAEAFRG